MLSIMDSVAGDSVDHVIGLGQFPEIRLRIIALPHPVVPLAASIRIGKDRRFPLTSFYEPL
jgi:hypothetical protein